MALAWDREGVVTRTISQPASARRRIPATAAGMSMVSSLIMDCTTTGWLLPMGTSPTITVRVGRRRTWVS